LSGSRSRVGPATASPGPKVASSVAWPQSLTEGPIVPHPATAGRDRSIPRRRARR
jgi:hypothetical protein